MTAGRLQRLWNAMREALSPPQRNLIHESGTVRGGSMNSRMLTERLLATSEHDAGRWGLNFPSSEPKMPFRVHFRVLYRDIQGKGDRGTAAAVAAARDRIAKLSAQHTLTQREHLQIDLETWLPELRQTAVRDVWAKAIEITVEVDEHLEQAAKAQDELWLRTQLHHWRYQQEIAQTRHARDLLADPARAAAWWLAHHPAEIERLPRVCESFTEAHRQVTADPGSGSGELNTLVTRLWEASEPHARHGLLKILHDFAVSYRHVSLAGDIERLFEESAS
ncbi:MAG: hypothetical protein ACRDXX_00205 [Stackebrandtia sp.]